MTRPTPAPPAQRIPHIGHKDLPPREDRDWVLSTELIDEAGISYRQLDYWCRTGLLTPREAIHGSGWTRSFTHDQVDRARVIKALIGAGTALAMGGVRDVIDEALASGHVQLGDITITIHNPSGDTAA